jgi:hypothetical protein
MTQAEMESAIASLEAKVAAMREADERRVNQSQTAAGWAWLVSVLFVLFAIIGTIAGLFIRTDVSGYVLPLYLVSSSFIFISLTLNIWTTATPARRTTQARRATV